MSRSRITTDDLWSDDPAEWAHNPAAGEILRLDFMEPLGLDAASLASMLGIDPSRLDDVMLGRSAIDADLDLRLSRYFRMSDGFFLRLQNAHDLLAARRAMKGALDRIVPRAA
jgi:addiction module HigA family antidote